MNRNFFLHPGIISETTVQKTIIDIQETTNFGFVNSNKLISNLMKPNFVVLDTAVLHRKIFI